MPPIISYVVQASLILLVASVGLQARWRDLTSVIAKPALLVRGVVAVNVVVPAVAFVMVWALPIAPVVKVAIFVMAVSPMAPFLPAKMLKAGADARYVVGLYAAIMLLAVILVPATIALAAAISGKTISAPVGALAMLVLESVLLPLAAGLLIATLAPEFARRAARIANIVAILALLPIVILILVKTGSGIVGLLGDGTLLAIVVTLAAGLAAGHWLGGPDSGERIALALAAATRHPSIAILILKHNYEDQRGVLSVILFLLAGLVASSIYQVWAKKRLGGTDRVATATGSSETG
jgi:BASS family bile acid:Na+ symporter